MSQSRLAAPKRGSGFIMIVVKIVGEHLWRGFVGDGPYGRDGVSRASIPPWFIAGFWVAASPGIRLTMEEIGGL